MALRWNSPAILEALAARQPFAVTNFTATTQPVEGDPMGQLPSSFRTVLEQHLIDCRITYLVYSYETPIAWVVDGHEVVIPDVQYSLTTGKHQKVVRDCLTTPAKPQYSVTWDGEGCTIDAYYDKEAERDARIIELVKSGATNVRIEG
jgi:hypothetical protein